MRKPVTFAAVCAAAAVVALLGARTASADYGNTAQYQAAISLNCDNKSAPFCTQVVGLGGVWKWFAFSNDGTFDSTETFCSHDPANGTGAFHLNGDGEWMVAPASPAAPPFGQTDDFWVNYNDGAGWQDSEVPYPGAGASRHYSFKPAPGISAVAQVSYIPGR
ncbi:MAG TPA: hypothetical protein VJ716_09235 [Gaiellaceae bacterium]|nr:hypothetical protein [Gaiellaceae bacterium]